MNNKHGFTLIELSIVIITIALIIAGVTAGRSMVKQSQLNRVISDFRQYASAINAFKLQYNYYPGDLKGTLYWGGGVDDGDQDGLVTGHDTEIFYAWEHLGRAKLISGSYTGIGSTAGNFQPGINVPKGQISELSGDSGVIFSYNRRISLALSGSVDNTSSTPAISPSDAKSLDIKVDDGIPNRGLFTAEDARNGTGYDWYEAGCTNPKTHTDGSQTTLTYSYAIAYQTTSIKRCSITMLF